MSCWLPRHSPLFDCDLALGMMGTGPVELGIQFLPAALGVPRKFYDVVGLQYTFKTGDLKDASFALRLSSQRLASLSPANAMSLGEGAQVVKIIGNSRVDQTLDWGQEFFGQITVVSAISGRAMVGWSVTWRSLDIGVVTSVTDFYGVAKVRFVPTTPGAAVLTATVGDEDYADSVSFPFFLNDPQEIQTLLSTEPTGYPGQEVSAQAMVVSTITGKPLADVEVMWDFPEVTIAPTKTDVEGKASVVFRLSADKPSVLGATVRGGYGGWNTELMLFTVLYGDLVIESVTSESTQTYVGVKTTAYAKLGSRQTGHSVRNVEVFWRYPGLELPSSHSNINGFTDIHFVPDKAGVYDLVAMTVEGVSAAKTFTVLDRTRNLVEFKGSGDYTVGDTAEISFRLVDTSTGEGVMGEEVFF